jgi:hypothetical protein
LSASAHQRAVSAADAGATSWTLITMRAGMPVPRSA